MFLRRKRKIAFFDEKSAFSVAIPLYSEQKEKEKKRIDIFFLFLHINMF